MGGIFIYISERIHLLAGKRENITRCYMLFFEEGWGEKEKPNIIRKHQHLIQGEAFAMLRLFFTHFTIHNTYVSDDLRERGREREMDGGVGFSSEGE